MQETCFISVILPLKLEWEPCYRCDSQTEVGDRVRVLFAGKEYIGVVSGTGVNPDIAPEKVKSIISIEKGIGRILCEEIQLWRKVSQYYLCSIGEVYKAAYPTEKINLEEARACSREKAIERRERVLKAMDSKIDRLKTRLENKIVLADKTKEGTKAKASYKSDILKITQEIAKAETARLAAAIDVEAIKTGTRDSLPLPQDTIVLSDAQKKAYEDILEGFDRNTPVLLHGVTGSGKTEIYIKLAIESIKLGRNVLYLVPEIALSRQLEDRLQAIFNDRLLTFHSGESAVSRRNSAETIRNMTARTGGYIALCTRSGLFLPHHDLGLIIVDEEHDSSYKQDSPAPRYNGRDTALMMSLIHPGCKVILGSATPSLEETFNVSTGRHRLVQLKERYHGADDSEVEIIDTKAERRKRGMVGSFSRRLIDHINRTLSDGNQVLILRSRRAWSTALQCTSCGEIQKCPHCNVSMSHHKSSGKTICHYCGYSTAYTGICSKCGNQLSDLGSGTQRIEEEAAALFPEARIARLDSDTAQNKSYQTKTIKDFAKGETDILIGTQIISKGFDFENLSLVVVIAADALLGIEDFRADEKAIHILEQLRGRCGRRGKKGLFVIQTAQPEHPVYRSMTSDGLQSFSDSLLAERQDFCFPPYTRIIELTVKDIYEDRAERMSYRLAQKLSGYNLTGPYAPGVSKIADRHLRKIRLSLKKDRDLVPLKERLKKLISDFEKGQKYEGHITIDVDPS